MTANLAIIIQKIIAAMQMNEYLTYCTYCSTIKMSAKNIYPVINRKSLQFVTF